MDTSACICARYCLIFYPASMSTSITTRPEDGKVIQFSVFTENKTGRLNDLLAIFAKEHIHIMALCAIDTTDSAITRFVVDYPEEARRILDIYGFPFNEVVVVSVEIETEAQIRNVTAALAAAEINVHYTYPFLMRPNGRCGLVLRLEDNELATEVLNAQGVKVLDRMDIAR